MTHTEIGQRRGGGHNPAVGERDRGDYDLACISRRNSNSGNNLTYVGKLTPGMNTGLGVVGNTMHQIDGENSAIRTTMQIIQGPANLTRLE